MKRIVYILLILAMSVSARAQLKPDDYTAHWIYNIASRTTWPDEKNIDTFVVAVYGKNTQVASYLKRIAEAQDMKGKPFIVRSYSRFSQIPLHLINVLYVEPNKNDFVQTILNEIGTNPVLLITYRAEDKDYIMVNLLFNGPKTQFEINSYNIKHANLVVDEQLLKLGGSKVDIKGLLTKKEKELIKKEKALKLTQDSIIKQQQALFAKEKQLQKLNLQLDKQKKDLRAKEEQLEIERQKSGELSEKIKNQVKLLNETKSYLDELNKQIEERKAEIKQKEAELQEKNKELRKKTKELDEKLKEIKKQQEVLKSQKSQIKSQQLVISITIIFLIVVLFLLLVIWKWYRLNRQMNIELTQKNKEIERQRNELQIQAKQLEEFNKELEKLSLVASRTQNSVVIMDPEGNIEWVNPGFTRMYGYTLQLLVNELDKNIKYISANPKIAEYVDYALKNKATVTYEARNKTRDGKVIWVQTSLTPILNEKDEVVKLFAIETDITKLKEQEKEIRQKNEELQRQKDALQEQKEQIEFQNQQIKDSIRYAKTIQAAILPPKELIDKYFESFIIFLPRDIVSGDFYWFAKTGENEFFFAVVDCTGHGVPGAFMSLIASRMLSEIVIEKNIRKPSSILEELNKTVIHTLNQHSSDNNDGMDVSLVKIEKRTLDYRIIYSGAKRPLFYYEHTQKEIQIIKGDRKSIGGVRSIKSKVRFTDKELFLHHDDIIYLSTDGLIDQNNPKRQRFGTPRFVDLLNQIKDFELDQQKIVIERELEAFKQNEPQRDDITIVALKMK